MMDAIMIASELAQTKVNAVSMIAYLQDMMDQFMEDKRMFGMDRATERKMDAMIACKEMVESLIGEPVNLGKDGNVTVGF